MRQADARRRPAPTRGREFGLAAGDGRHAAGIRVEIVDRIFFSVWIAFLLPSALLLACAEIGFAVGRRAFRHDDHTIRSTIGGIQGAILGLLGLLLGFTFALAANRYDERRLLVVSEANAIGTTYLRAALLPADQIEPARELLRRYVALRIEAYPLFDDPVVRVSFLKRSAELQASLWDRAVATARTQPTAMTALYVSAVNDMIDAEGERIGASRARIPPSVWLLLLIVAGLGCLTSSYAAGVEGARTVFSSFVLPLLIAIVITMIFDIMHPRKGLIGISQQPLVDLQQSIRATGG
jgi:hypothetical protein